MKNVNVQFRPERLGANQIGNADLPAHGFHCEFLQAFTGKCHRAVRLQVSCCHLDEEQSYIGSRITDNGLQSIFDVSVPAVVPLAQPFALFLKFDDAVPLAITPAPHPEVGRQSVANDGDLAGGLVVAHGVNHKPSHPHTGNQPRRDHLCACRPGQQQRGNEQDGQRQSGRTRERAQQQDHNRACVPPQAPALRGAGSDKQPHTQHDQKNENRFGIDSPGLRDETQIERKDKRRQQPYVSVKNPPREIEGRQAHQHVQHRLPEASRLHHQVFGQQQVEEGKIDRIYRADDDAPRFGRGRADGEVLPQYEVERRVAAPQFWRGIGHQHPMQAQGQREQQNGKERNAHPAVRVGADRRMRVEQVVFPVHSISIAAGRSPAPPAGSVGSAWKSPSRSEAGSLSLRRTGQ